MKINICFSSDNNYAQHLGVTIASILSNSNFNDSYEFYIMDGGISLKNKNKINELKKIRNFSISYIKMDNNDFRDCPITNYTNYITLPTYYRFKIPTLFSQIDKILYMDCDMIVEDDIANLFNIEIENYYLGAVPEVFNHNHKKRLELSTSEYYFNAGLLLINNKKWIKDNIQEKLFKYIEKPKHEIVYQDQDILNEVLKGNVKYLHLKWNLQHYALLSEESYLYHQRERVSAIQKPSIIHFSNKVKPWQIHCLNKFYILYFKYLQITPWKNYKLKYNYLLLKSKIHEILFSKKFVQNIFSMKNSKNGIHRIITILGIKFKFKSEKLMRRRRFEDINNRLIQREIEINDLTKRVCILEDKLNINSK